jgi:carbamoyl-phosphate synthase large subunit
MKTVLVSGASGIVGYGALRSLRKHDSQLRLLGTSIYPDSVAPAFCDTFVLAPRTNSSEYMDWLDATIRQHAVDLIIPGVEVDMFKWGEQRSRIEATGAIPLLNDARLIELCRDKWLFYQHLGSAQIACAIPSCLSQDFDQLQAGLGLPLLLKPRNGFGSKGIVRVHSREDFAPHAQFVGTTLMAQPIVGSDEEEYTTSAFGDGQGKIVACMTLKRRLSKDGYTEKAVVTSSDFFMPAIAELVAEFKPLGPTNFQFRKCADGVKLLEINPRVSSSTAIRTAFGYNECGMSVDFFLHGKMPVQPAIQGGSAVRYTDEYIFHETGVHL